MDESVTTMENEMFITHVMYKSGPPMGMLMVGPPHMATAYAPTKATMSAYDTSPSAGVPCMLDMAV